MAPSKTPNGDQARPLCFLIGPYGDRGSKTRQWSDFVFSKIVEPVLKDCYQVQRTIDCPEPGQISARIKRDLDAAPLVIADLTADNPNVYYELGYRHALKRPFIHLVRADNARLPFDLQDFEVIQIPANFVEDQTDPSQSYYSIRDDHLQQVRNSLRVQIDGIDPEPPPRSEPFLAKVYRWDVFYSPRIASDWLAAQPDAVQKQIASYENGGGTDSVSEDSLTQFAEYLALKAAACLSGEGTIVMVMNNMSRALDFGHAVFKFSSAPEPILINIKSASCNGSGMASITFKQEPRPFPIDRGGRTVSVWIPGYMYTLQISVPDTDGSARGVIVHPNTKTVIGNAELSPRYGDTFR
jgi:hypothetical protein